MIPQWQPQPERDRATEQQSYQYSSSVPGSPPAPEEEDAGTYDPVIRPFLVTGGRTRPVADNLRIETLLYAQPAALSAPLRFEARRIVQLCQQPMSVADIAAALRVPLGVTRVLVGDLIAEKYLQVAEQQDELSIELIERIRDRVRAL